MEIEEQLLTVVSTKAHCERLKRMKYVAHIFYNKIHINYVHI